MVFHILIWGAWGFVCRYEDHQSIPLATRLNPPELPISDEAWNDLHIASTGVKLALAHTQGCHIKNETGNEWCIKKSAKPNKLKQDSFEIWLKTN